MRLSQLWVGLHRLKVFAQRAIPIFLKRQRIADIQVNNGALAIKYLGLLLAFDIRRDQGGLEMLDRIAVGSPQIGADTLAKRSPKARTSHKALAPGKRVQVKRHKA